MQRSTGRTAQILAKYIGSCRRLTGVDLVDFSPILTGMELLKHDFGEIPLESASVGLVMARGVMEHVTDPARVYSEVYRVLRPGGRFIFLTAKLWDYSAIIAKLVPNRFTSSLTRSCFWWLPDMRS